MPSFKQEIEKFVEADRKAIESKGIANKQCRLDEYNRRWKKMQALIDARAEWGLAQDIPGGDTGLLCQDYKGTVEVYKFDAALQREMRELEKQAAIEAAQWTEKTDLTSDGKSLQQQQPIINVYASESVESDKAAKD